MRRSPIAAALFVVSSATASAQERHSHAGADLGVVSFANSGAASAQGPFQRGIALLHSFEYDEAAEAFRAASNADRNFAMAYWAEALTHTHPLWGEDDPVAARRALARLAPTRDARLAKAGTPRERAYGAAVEAFYADTDLATRARAFADAMRRVSRAYANDVDAAAFTALALLTAQYVGNLPAADGRAARDEAITIAQRIFRTNPSHPGAAHYLIHATDDPAFAARGLEAARKYAEIAPAAEHALHMPSHIFLQLGLWDDDASSNERAWAASRAEVKARSSRTPI
jgi:tetratricopeptide (TPR) repeat protein